MSEHCWEGFQMKRSKFKVMTDQLPHI